MQPYYHDDSIIELNGMSTNVLFERSGKKL